MAGQNVAKGAQGAKAVKITRESKNEVLEKAFGALLDKPVVFAILPSANADYNMMYIAQRGTVDGQEVTAVQKKFLGWDDRGPRIMRCIQAIATDVQEELELKVGDVLEGFKISVVRLDVPAFEGQEPVQKIEDGEIVGDLLLNGKPVYEHRELVEA